MGNVEVHDLSPVRDDERKELNLSRKVSYQQYCKHVQGHVDSSCLKELPWSIRDAISLYERMNCSFNAIREVPKELPLRLPHLNFIDISHNQLTFLPESFGLLFHLRTLLLRSNSITQLPESFVHLVKLEKVDLSFNNLKSLPKDFSKMEALSKLNVGSNKLKTIPISLGGVVTLTVLLAADNKLHDPPQSVANQGSEELICYLRKSFKLGGNQIERLHTSGLNVFPRVRGNQLMTSVPNPHSAQMQYIQSQTMTTNTPNRIKTPLQPPTGATLLEADELRDRITGLLYGAAIGDAVGLATCCMTQDECAFYYDPEMIRFSDIIPDGYRVRWKPGDWTSNFDKMMLVLESIIGWAGVVDELDFAKRLNTWLETGFPELGDKEGILFSDHMKQVCGDREFLRNPHEASQRVLEESLLCTDQLSGGTLREEDEGSSICSDQSNLSSHSNTSHTSSCMSEIFPACSVTGADNTAIVHIPILGVPGFYLLPEVEANTIRICKTTHSDPHCVASCVVIATVVSFMLQGKHCLNSYKSVDEIISKSVQEGIKHLREQDKKDEFLNYCHMTNVSSLNARETDNEAYTYKAMAAGLIALRSQQSFKTFLMKLVMEGGDSTSNGCVAGALLGCKFGFSHLPPEWIQGLMKKQKVWLNKKINLFLDMMGLP